MTQHRNEFEQLIGEALPGWTPPVWPSRKPMEGRFCRIEPLVVECHLEDVFKAFSEDSDGKLWTYMPVGPFRTIEELHYWMVPACKTDDPLFHALIELRTGKAVGMAAYWRIKPALGVIEVGSISYSPRLQRTAMATEVMFLLMNRVFTELAYRRYEWKCDSLNAASRRAAERYGFTYDGLFKQAMVYKGRNRDTAWYSMIDSDWPAIKRAYVSWLDVGNFDENGQQKRKLQELIALARRR